MLKNNDVMDSIHLLAECKTEAEAFELTKEIVETLGAESFVYTSLLPQASNATEENIQYFIGCNPELCKVYSSRMWKMNDPFFEYARTNSAPILGSKIVAKTAGQLDIIKITQSLGFSSGLIIPTHSSMDSSKRMGVLYVGSELPVEIGEPLFLKKRIQFGALGTELLLWWTIRLRKKAMRRFSLVDEEVELLKMCKKGYVASEIAANHDIKATLVYRKLNIIKEKFNVEKIEHAVIEADAAGLFG